MGDESDFYKGSGESAIQRKLKAKQDNPEDSIYEALGPNGLLHPDVPQSIRDDVAPHLLKIKHKMNLGAK